MLQVGGVHEAIMVAPPPPVTADAAPPLSTVTDPVSEELQVNGTSVMVTPCVSTTVGIMVFEPADDPVTVSKID